MWHKCYIVLTVERKPGKLLASYRFPKWQFLLQYHMWPLPYNPCIIVRYPTTPQYIPYKGTHYEINWWDGVLRSRGIHPECSFPEYRAAQVQGCVFVSTAETNVSPSSDPLSQYHPSASEMISGVATTRRRDKPAVLVTCVYRCWWGHITWVGW